MALIYWSGADVFCLVNFWGLEAVPSCKIDNLPDLASLSQFVVDKSGQICGSVS